MSCTIDYYELERLAENAGQFASLAFTIASATSESGSSTAAYEGAIAILSDKLLEHKTEMAELVRSAQKIPIKENVTGEAATSTDDKSK